MIKTPNVFFYRAIAKTKLGIFKEAIEDYDKVIKLNPKHPRSFYYRGILKGDQGKYKEALQDFQKATTYLKSNIKINPDKDDYEIIKEKVKKLF